MTTATVIADLIESAKRRPITEEEAAPALAWLKAAQRDEIAQALMSLAELEQQRIDVQTRHIEARERQIELVAKHVAPRIVWSIMVLFMAAAAALATKIGIPLSFIFDDLP
jgi:hypothetical protein